MDTPQIGHRSTGSRHSDFSTSHSLNLYHIYVPAVHRLPKRITAAQKEICAHARGRGRETPPICLASLAIRDLPGCLSRALFWASSSVSCGPARFAQQAQPTAFVQAQRDAHAPTVQFLLRRDVRSFAIVLFRDMSWLIIHTRGL